MSESRQGYWNHRVVRYKEPDGSVSFGIHEAHYYVGDRKPFAITENATPVLADDGNAMQDTLTHMQRALTQPLLDYETREELSSRAAIFSMNDLAERGDPGRGD